MEFHKWLHVFTVSYGTTLNLNFSITYKRSVEFQMEIKVIFLAVSVCRRRRLCWFHVVVLHRTTKKNARAELLFCQLDLLFSHVYVAVAVVVCLRDLRKPQRRQQQGHGKAKDLMSRSIARHIFFLTLHIFQPTSANCKSAITDTDICMVWNRTPRQRIIKCRFGTQRHHRLPKLLCTLKTSKYQ